MEKLISAFLAVTGLNGNGKRVVGLAGLAAAALIWATAQAGQEVDPATAVAVVAGAQWVWGVLAAWARRSLW